MAWALRSLHHQHRLRHRKARNYHTSKVERRVSLAGVFRTRQLHDPKHLPWSTSWSSWEITVCLDAILLKRKPFKFMEWAVVIYALLRPYKPSGNLCHSHQSQKAFGRGLKIKRKDQRETVVKLNTAYFLAKEELPFSKFEGLLVLQKDGVEINFTYSNAKLCSEMVSGIGKVFKDQHTKKATETNHISAMADGASDVGRVEKETVYFRFVWWKTSKLLSGPHSTQYLIFASWQWHFKLWKLKLQTKILRVQVLS